jgi:S-adenosylmethionine synthetase
MAKKSKSTVVQTHLKKYLFTSESVTMGHPDKVADHISDAILDAMLAQDPQSRVACETMVKADMVLVAGEITSQATVDIPTVVRDTIKKIGYDKPELGFHCDNCAILVAIGKQSPNISQGVIEGEGLHEEQGAGDQGMMFGYACKETPELMPMPIQLAHALTIRLAEVRENGTLPWLRPDGKSQVTVEYDSGKPKRIHTVVMAAQHDPGIDHNRLSSEVKDKVILPVLPEGLVDHDTAFHINATGVFEMGGPAVDCGLTGRKIIVDTYGGRGCHGGGAFSGKDPTKVDRTASYMARYIAKNIVAAGLADACEVQLAYVIGVADPVSLLVQTEATAKISETRISEIIRELFPLKPKEMIEYLNLARPIYTATTNGGHFGRSHPDFTWEKTGMTAKLRKAAGLKPRRK